MGRRLIAQVAPFRIVIAERSSCSHRAEAVSRIVLGEMLATSNLGEVVNRLTGQRWELVPPTA